MFELNLEDIMFPNDRSIWPVEEHQNIFEGKTKRHTFIT